MNTKNITDKVSYCGVNDRTSALFENIWDLPNGVTYNSYIVRGKKATAIIDGSDTDHASEFISHITDTIETSWRPTSTFHTYAYGPLAGNHVHLR